MEIMIKTAQEFHDAHVTIEIRADQDEAEQREKIVGLERVAKSRLGEISHMEERQATLSARISDLTGWLDLRNGELASANEQRDQARARAAQMEDLLALRNGELVSANEQRDQARAQVRDVRAAQEVTRREMVRAKEQRDDYQAQLAEIRNVVFSDVLDQALMVVDNSEADSARRLAEALLTIRELLQASS
jgi:chromosome segregation ATPase